MKLLVVCLLKAVATLCGFKAKTKYKARPLNTCLCGVQTCFTRDNQKEREYKYVCMCVFAITRANSTIWETEREKQDKEGVLLMVLARFGNWVGERTQGWSFLFPHSCSPRGQAGAAHHSCGENWHIAPRYQEFPLTGSLFLCFRPN